MTFWGRSRKISNSNRRDQDWSQIKHGGNPIAFKDDEAHEAIWLGDCITITSFVASLHHSGLGVPQLVWSDNNADSKSFERVIASLIPLFRNIASCSGARNRLARGAATLGGWIFGQIVV
jgi:hypothetical protein